MDKLPVELIEKILNHQILTLQDIVNVSSTCKYLRDSVLGSHIIWKNIFCEKWSDMLKLNFKIENYYEEIQYIHNLKNRIILLLEKMASRYHDKSQLSDMDFADWEALLNEKRQTFNYLVAMLIEIINVNEPINSISIVPLNTPGNKTLQYYACKALRYIKQKKLSEFWLTFRNLPAKEQILEKGATFVAHWCQTEKNLSDEYIGNQLNEIANLVRTRLFEVYPEHEVFKVSNKELNCWEKGNLSESKWSFFECHQLITMMEEVIFGELGFSLEYEPSLSLINLVLESRRGNIIILSIIYACAGRRLGLVFEPVSFQNHFLLRFVGRELANTNTYYIDICNKGIMIQKTSCPYRPPTDRNVTLPVASTIDVVNKLVEKLDLSLRENTNLFGLVTSIRTILELSVLVNPRNLSAIMRLAQFYSQYRLNSKNFETYLLSQPFPPQIENVLATLRTFSEPVDLNLVQNKSATPRSADLKYGVGMIAIDKTNFISTKCVIYDWNPTCQLTEACPYWPSRDKFKPKQPCYDVLREDGTFKHLPQEDLKPTTEIGLLHSVPDVGRYFSHFFVNHFVPNAETEKRYPFDAEVRHKFYHRAHLKTYEP